MSLNFERARHGWLRACALVFGALVSLPFATRADSTPHRLVILQSEAPGVSARLRRHVDEQVLESLRQRAAFEQAYVSPVPFEDVELAAGCSGREAGCLQRIAATLDADWMMVRELAKDESGRVYLTLVAHDGPGAIVTRRAVAEVAENRRQTPAQVVPLLIDRLYPESGASESSASAARVVLPAPKLERERVRPERERGPDAASAGRSSAKIVGWTSAAAGGALLAAGMVVGALSLRDQRTHDDLSVGSELEADRARALFSRANRRTDIANGLIIGGAGAGAVGIAALLWNYFRPKRDERLSVRVLPARSGVALSLRASFRGGI